MGLDHNICHPLITLAKLCLVTLIMLSPNVAVAQGEDELMSLSMRDVQLSEVMNMLSRKKRVNILLAQDVEARVSFSLYDVRLDEAIRAIASAAGFAVEIRDGNYFVVDHDEAGKYKDGGLTEVRTYDIQYAEPTAIEQALRPYLSEYGELTSLPERDMLMVEDTPEFLVRIETLLRQLDREPKQILIEAKILEVTLNDEDSSGIDWSKLFASDEGSGSFGTQGLSGPGLSGTAGFFFDIATPNIEATLNALEANGRLRTLSTPSLLALENQEASVIIGDRRGYQITTTINQVTTESIEFLESGVILRVTPYVDDRGRVLMDIHPEVSTGTVDDNGIPSQTTTEVTTRMHVPGGKTIFIGGLMKHTLTEARQGVPVLGKVPGLRRLFSNKLKTNANTETIVLITPHVVSDFSERWNVDARQKVDAAEKVLERETERGESELNEHFKETNDKASDAVTHEKSVSPRANIAQPPPTRPFPYR